MYIVYIRNYRKKIIILSVVFVLCAVALLISKLLLGNSLIFNVTIDHCLTFSYPYKLHINHIYVNKDADTDAVETSSLLNKPGLQKFSNFHSVKGKFSFSYPSVFTLSQKDFTGSEILYHIDFNDKPKVIHGFIQVWSLPYSLKDFLDSSKENSQVAFKNFYTKPVSINNLPGFLWDYSFTGNDNKLYKGMEVFLQKKNKMYRISYFIPKDKYNKAHSDTFWEMVYSLKTDS